VPWDPRRDHGQWVPDGIRGSNTRRQAGDFCASESHANSITLRESQEALENQGLRSHQAGFSTHTLSRRPQTLSGPRDRNGFPGGAYQAETWQAAQSLVIEVEAYAQGNNRRAVVTNSPRYAALPSPAFDECAERGDRVQFARRMW
jgi:hypothetical protein